MLEFETRTDIQINSAWHEVEVIDTQGEYSYVLPLQGSPLRPKLYPSDLDYVSVIRIRTDSPRLREVKFLDAVLDSVTGQIVGFKDYEARPARHQRVQIIVKE